MEVLIERLNDQGLGICYINNIITFVPNTVIGDLVDIEVIEKYKKYNIGKVIKYIKKSINRIESICPYSTLCGGCALLNINYDMGLEFKKNKVKNILKKFSNIDIDLDIISFNNINYRNKITIHVKDRKIGYYQDKTNNLVEINNCIIANREINKFIKEINNYNIINGEVVIRCNYNNELLINFITNDKLTIVKSNLKIVGILQNGKVLFGEDNFIEKINNLYFKVSYNSFFQINRDITSYLFNFIKENILKNKNVLDLYCGVGTLGLNIAKEENNVYGIEIVRNAVENAIINSKINNINNTYYLCGEVKDCIDKIKNNIEVIIIDPPRSGLDNKSISVINKMLPEQIIYVSCNPITLARDLNSFKDYKIDKIVALDMFPNTYHVECVCVLKLR